MRRYWLRLALCVCVWLPACGGGSDSSSDAGRGTLMGGAVQGSPLALSREVTTFAGVSHAMRDGTGAAASFFDPRGIASDGANLFVADTGNRTIRKVVIATGQVTTLAGSPGSEGSADGVGAGAGFAGPNGLALLGGSLFVADLHAIRRVSVTTGEVTTLAGSAANAGSADGVGAAARFGLAADVAADGTDLFVVDAGNHTVRRVSPVTGEVTTLAGSPGEPGFADGIGAEARFCNAQGIASDGVHLYVSDTIYGRIRKVVIATGEVTTLAGSGAFGSADGVGAEAAFHHPIGIATDGTSLFVADTTNCTIRMIAIATGQVTTLAGTAGAEGSQDGAGAEATFLHPQGVASVGGELFVADTEGCTIRRVAATGQTSTLAGASAAPGWADGAAAEARFSNPAAVVTDGTELFVADRGNHNVRRVALATGDVATLAGAAGEPGSADGAAAAARFSSPSGVTTDGTSVFVADTGNRTIRRIAIATGEVTTLAGSAGNAGVTDATGEAARFLEPRALTTDGRNLFVADGNAVRRVTIATGEVTTLAGSAEDAGSADGLGPAARFEGPGGLTTDGAHVYAADSYTLRRVSIVTGAVTTLAGTAGLEGSEDGVGAAARFRWPAELTTDGTSIFVVDTGNQTIRKVVIATGEVTTVAGHPGWSQWADGTGTAARFSSPWGITTDGEALFVTDVHDQAIRRIE